MDSLLIKELKKKTKINIDEVISNSDTFLNENHYYYYLKYNIFKILIEKKYLYFNESLIYIERTDKNKLKEYLNSNIHYSFHKEFNKSNKINNNLPNSFEHYVIYYLFDWKEINDLDKYRKSKNELYIDILNNNIKVTLSLILNTNEYINEYIINIEENLNNYFLETELLKKIIIKNNNVNIISQIIHIFELCQNKTNYKLSILNDLNNLQKNNNQYSVIENNIQNNQIK